MQHPCWAKQYLQQYADKLHWLYSENVQNETQLQTAVLDSANHCFVPTAEKQHLI